MIAPSSTVPSSTSLPLSIIITAYNEGAEVRQTLDSIAANTTGPYEVVLVDDGSTDGCCERIDIDILHLSGPLARHFFRDARQIPYSTPWDAVWRNHALVARVCFDDKTWYEHWLPNVFYKHLTAEAKRDLESPAVLAEHEAFLAQKVRPDREFWRGLLQTEEPACLRP